MSEHDSVPMIKIWLRNSRDTLFVRQTTDEQAQATLAFAAHTFLRFPPEARPSACWILAKDSIKTVLDDQGIANETEMDIIALVDPREIQAVQVVKFHPMPVMQQPDKESWE